MRLFKIADDTAAVTLGRADKPIEVGHYGERTWAVYYGGELLCVTVYLKGAMAVQRLIGQLQAELRLAKDGETAIPPLIAPEGGFGCLAEPNHGASSE